MQSDKSEEDSEKDPAKSLMKYQSSDMIQNGNLAGIFQNRLSCSNPWHDTKTTWS